MNGNSHVIIPGTTPSGRGYVSDVMTNSESFFATAPLFTKTFDVSHDLPVLAIRFDTALNEHPASIRVKCYKGTTLLNTQTVNGITSAEVFVSTSKAVDCTKIEVAMYGNLPYRRI